MYFKNKSKSWILFFFVLFMVIVGCQKEVEAGPTAPDFSLKDLSGQTVTLEQYRGKVVLLDFWATWCPPCRAEIPHFVELYSEYRKKGLEVIGVSLDSNPEKALLPFIEEYKINYTMLIGNRDVTDSYGGVISIPTTFVIDREGNIRKKYLGYRDKSVFEKDIEELL